MSFLQAPQYSSFKFRVARVYDVFSEELDGSLSVTDKVDEKYDIAENVFGAVNEIQDTVGTLEEGILQTLNNRSINNEASMLAQGIYESIMPNVEALAVAGDETTETGGRALVQSTSRSFRLPEKFVKSIQSRDPFSMDENIV